MSKATIYILITLSLVSCNWKDYLPGITEDNLNCLYMQRIEGSNLVLYKFSYSGSFATSSNYNGVTILDSSETFSYDKIKEFPTEYFKSKPIGNELKLIKITNGSNPKTEKDTLLVPFRTYSETINGANLHIVEYKSTYGSATKNTGLMRYEFDTYSETKAFITLNNITKTFGGKVFSDTTSFEKGNITIMEDDYQNLIYIQIDQPIIERGDIYKPTDPFELVPNQAIVGVATYKFYPRDSLSTSSLSEIGLWRRIK